LLEEEFRNKELETFDIKSLQRSNVK